MARNKLTKKETEKIRLHAKAYERELLVELLIDSEDQNIIDLVDEALVTVKLIHGEELAKNVGVQIERDEQSLLQYKMRKKHNDDDMKRMMGGHGSYGNLGGWPDQINQNGNVWYDESSYYDGHKQGLWSNPSNTIWETDNSAAGGSTFGQSNMSITKLAEQIQIINDLKINHSLLGDHISGITYDDLVANTKKKKK